MRKIYLICLCLFAFSLRINCKDYIIQPANLTSSPYDIWAHYHWIWLANPEENQKNISKLVDDYISYDIPVGAVNIDSSWPQTYQNFIWNAGKFPNASEMVSELHNKNVKVIAWITSTINNDSTNFNEGLERGYYLNKGKLIDWWRGHGALLDYRYLQ